MFAVTSLRSRSTFPSPLLRISIVSATRMDRGYAPYIHSAASGEELRAKGGNWRLPNTKLILKPKGAAGDSAHYGFRFRWAPYYNGVRDVLYEEGAKRRRMLSVSAHDRISGHPARVKAFADFIDYAQKHKGVWFARKDEIARWTLERANTIHAK